MNDDDDDKKQKAEINLDGFFCLIIMMDLLLVTKQVVRTTYGTIDNTVLQYIQYDTVESTASFMVSFIFSAFGYTTCTSTSITDEGKFIISF